MPEAKPYDISKQVVWEAYLKVKANHGAAGVDRQSIEAFGTDLKGNLYKIWNRMSSGSYFPPPVRLLEIPKATGGTRPLGIPTVGDRVAQMVVKMHLEPLAEPHFHPDSYGYRPRKSALDAVATARERCWRSDWVIDLDIKGFFDNLDHELVMKTVRHHTKTPWILLYIERWLKAPVQKQDGSREERTKGSPQGSVITPPTMLQTTTLGAAFKRGRTDPIHDANLLLVDLDLLDQRPNDFPSRLPARLLQFLGNTFGELLQLADHQPEFRLLGGLVCPLPALVLPLRQPLFRRQDPRLKFGLVEQPVAVGIDQSGYQSSHIIDNFVDMLQFVALVRPRSLESSLVLCPYPLGLGQQLTHVFPDRSVQDIGPDLFVPAEARPPKRYASEPVQR